MTITRKHTKQRMSQLVIHADTVYPAGQVAEVRLASPDLPVEVGVIATK